MQGSCSTTVALTLSALNTSTVAVIEGQDTDISCVASANPEPSTAIFWMFDDSSTPFAQIDTSENRSVYVIDGGGYAFTEGNVTSTLHISNASYPTHDGVYQCSISNDTITLNATITVEVQGSLNE